MNRRFDAQAPELMDRPEVSPAELETALDNLRTLNRYFGSYRVVAHFLDRWMKPGDRLRALDLATGSADIPRLVAEHARRIGATVEIVAVDFHPVTIALARQLSADYPEIVCECADVFQFGGQERFDLVFCSLALHHFSDEEAVRLLRHARELASAHVLVSDLRRGWLASIGVRLLTGLIFRDRITRMDGRVSAARAFSFAELRDLATRAGWRNFGARRFRFARQAIWLDVKES